VIESSRLRRLNDEPEREGTTAALRLLRGVHGSTREEESPFNKCAHASLAAGRAPFGTCP
jgi:hypothetical protein